MFFSPSVADNPSGAKGCTTHGINPKLFIFLVNYFVSLELSSRAKEVYSTLNLFYILSLH